MSRNLTNVWTFDRDRGATLRLGGGTISDSILGGTRHFFLLNLYNFKNIGGGYPISGRKKRRKLHAIVAEAKHHGNMSVN